MFGFKKLKRYLRDPKFALGCDLIQKHPNWMSDKFFLEVQGRLNMGYKLNLEMPHTFCEKINWLKLYERNPLYTVLVDKYRVKLWLQEHFCSDYIIPTLAVYETVDEINLDLLPDAFVIKCNHDSGSVYICHDKSSGIYYDKYMNALTFNEVKSCLSKGLSHNFYFDNREWPYKNVSPCIIVEKLLLQSDGTIPNDYKLFYINGEFEFTYVSYDREGVNDRCTYDKDWNRLPFVYVDHYNEIMNTSDVPCPATYEQMLDFGKKISEYFKFVRVDLYDVDGKMYFGEVTPYHSAGYSKFYPEKYDAIYANKLKI